MPPELAAPSVLPSLASGRLRRNGPLLVVYGLLLALIVGVSVSSARDQFWRYSNIFNLLRQTAFLGTLALGQMLVILTGGIDLSVGSLVKLSVLVSAIAMSTRTGTSWVAAPDNVWLGIVG